MHHIMQFFAEIRQKIVGGGVKKSVKFFTVFLVLILCFPFVAFCAPDCDDVVKDYFGICNSISKDDVQNTPSFIQDVISSKTMKKIENAASGKRGAGYGTDFLIVAGNQVVGNELTGVFVCSFQMNAKVDQNCNGESGCKGGDNKRVGHLDHSVLSTGQSCQWFCADGWTGINKNPKPDVSDLSGYTNWLKKENGWCTTKIINENTQNLYISAGHIDSISTDSWPNIYYTPDAYDHLYKNWIHNSSGTDYNYNTLGTRYILARSYVGSTGVKIQPAIIATSLTTDFYIAQTNAKPYANKDVGDAKIFCLPGYRGSNCEKINEPTPCAGKTKIPLGSADGDGWKSVNNTGNQTKGNQYCVCTSTTDMGTCKYRILDFGGKSISTCTNLSSGWCSFSVNNTTAYKTPTRDIAGDNYDPTDVKNRCKPGYYGNFSFGDSDGNVIINGGCNACPTPDFVGTYFEANETKPVKDTDWKWVDSKTNFGPNTQLCKVQSIPSSKSEQGCTGNKILIGDSCYARFKDKNNNYFIIPESGYNNGICDF